MLNRQRIVYLLYIFAQALHVNDMEQGKQMKNITCRVNHIKGAFACMYGFNMLKMFDSEEWTDVAHLCFLPWITIIDLLQGLDRRATPLMQLFLSYMA